jgi:hypothetical protein
MSPNPQFAIVLVTVGVDFTKYFNLTICARAQLKPCDVIRNKKELVSCGFSFFDF